MAVGQHQFSHCLAPGTILAQHRVIEILGQGGFGITYRVADSTGQPAALKEFFPCDDAERLPDQRVAPKAGREERFRLGYAAFLEEARTLNALPSQRGLVRIRGAFERHGTVCALMDFVNGETLDRAAKSVVRRHDHIPVVLVRELADALLNALGAIHRVGVLHRDIKPGNVMIDRENHPVLIDFGAARPMRRTSNLASMYSRSYAALEQFPPSRTGFRGRDANTPAVDIYGFSVMLYELVSQSLPPDAAERFRQFSTTGQDPYLPVARNIQRNRIAGRYPEQFLAAIDAGCRLLPEERLRSAAEMASLMEGFVSAPVGSPGTRSRLPQRTSGGGALPGSSSVAVSPPVRIGTAPANDAARGRDRRSSRSTVWPIFAIILAIALGGVAYGLLMQ